MSPTEELGLEEQKIPKEIQNDPRFYVDKIAVLSAPSELVQPAQPFPSPLSSDQREEIARIVKQQQEQQEQQERQHQEREDLSRQIKQQIVINEQSDEDRQQEQQRNAPTEQDLLRELDDEVRERFKVLGDKLLVRLVQENAQKSKGGIFLVDENAQTDRAVVVSVGEVSYRNAFAEPILSKIRDVSCRSEEKRGEIKRVEVILSKTRQDSHEFRYKGQAYLFVPCVFALAVEPFYTKDSE